MTTSATSRRAFLQTSAAAAAAAAALTMTGTRRAAALPAGKPNVLFIPVDDLNHWVRHLGRNEQVITPNIDRLASRGMTFTRAYCPAPVCNASRAALMSGLRPSTTGVYDNNDDWRTVVPEDLPLTSHFRRHGYFVAAAGKVYHGGLDRRSEFEAYLENEGGGSRRMPAPEGSDGVGGIKFAPLDCRDEDLPDWTITQWCIDQLQKEQRRPFFLTCGLHKPHMPWNVPRKYFDAYPLEKVELPPSLESDLDDVPPEGVRMAAPNGDHAAILKSGRWKEAVRAYLATITYCDMNVGRLLDALQRSAYRDNTIVCLWGDHGWHLGEKLHWRKFALWEEATRAPFVWSVPGTTKPGSLCGRTVDFMSVYPTLAELCGLPVPGHVEGVSIRPLLADANAPWGRPALTTFKEGNHAVRTERWRYIRYRDGGQELYDEVNDPLERTNLAGRADLTSVKAGLARSMPTANKPAVGGGGRGGRRNGSPAERRAGQAGRRGAPPGA